MTNEQLNQLKIELETISNNVQRMIIIMNSHGKNLQEIDSEAQPEEFNEALKAYSKSKNELTSYLLTVVDALGVTLLDVIDYVQSSPKQKLWVPEGVR